MFNWLNDIHFWKQNLNDNSLTERKGFPWSFRCSLNHEVCRKGVRLEYHILPKDILLGVGFTMDGDEEELQVSFRNPLFSVYLTAEGFIPEFILKKLKQGEFHTGLTITNEVIIWDFHRDQSYYDMFNSPWYRHFFLDYKEYLFGYFEREEIIRKIYTTEIKTRDETLYCFLEVKDVRVKRKRWPLWENLSVIDVSVYKEENLKTRGVKYEDNPVFCISLHNMKSIYQAMGKVWEFIYKRNHKLPINVKGLTHYNPKEFDTIKLRNIDMEVCL